MVRNSQGWNNQGWGTARKGFTGHYGKGNDAQGGKGKPHWSWDGNGLTVDYGDNAKGDKGNTGNGKGAEGDNGKGSGSGDGGAGGSTVWAGSAWATPTSGVLTTLSVSHDPSQPVDGVFYCSHYLRCHADGSLLCAGCQPYKDYVGCCGTTMHKNQIIKHRGDGLCKACYDEKQKAEGRFQRAHLVADGQHGMRVSVPMADTFAIKGKGGSAAPAIPQDIQNKWAQASSRGRSEARIGVSAEARAGTSDTADEAAMMVKAQTEFPDSASQGHTEAYEASTAPLSAPPGLKCSGTLLPEGHTRLEMWDSKPMEVNLQCSREQLLNEGANYKPEAPTSIDEAKTRLARIMIDMMQVHAYCESMVGEA